MHRQCPTAAGGRGKGVQNKFTISALDRDQSAPIVVAPEGGAMLERLPTANDRLEWISRARADLTTFPWEVRSVCAYALLLAEMGSKHPDAKPMTGDPAFRGAGVLEVV